MPIIIIVNPGSCILFINLLKNVSGLKYNPSYQIEALVNFHSTSALLWILAKVVVMSEMRRFIMMITTRTFKVLNLLISIIIIIHP